MITLPNVVISGRRLLKTQTLYKRYKLGFEGERFTGELLNQLMKDGCEVFHDVPMEGYNVDHVVVAKQGVFAIETKTRRKRKDAGREKAQVRFDGKMLHWPDGSRNDYGIQNAVDRAAGLSQLLSDTTGEPVQAVPVLEHFPSNLGRLICTCVVLSVRS
ncbi:MAG: hypothetical protein E1N59_1906 [Puniceicoccaceae bacterium 5H]|nr:MAG: hypothetical protein E1N59_1906 [Puniceicoccaceae bacterium 5H]